MVLPIVAYGANILRAKSEAITPDYPNLAKILHNMEETLYASNGVGLAAPQVNLPIRVFIVDSQQIFEHMDEDEKARYADAPGVKKIFINATIEDLTGDDWSYNEGCLSIPHIREDVQRPEAVTLHYQDENFLPHVETFYGLTARIIQHEYDHIEGKLFIDYLKPLKKKMLQGKLNDISKGKIKVDYKMVFPK